jgi:hypothetical protein
MTEEEIKYNAEEYANRYEIRGTSDGEFRYMDKKDAYIVGAHSRDEEVEGLKKKLEDITTLKDFFASSLDIYDKDNRELQDELNILRNQWISVKERLPKKNDGKIRSDVVLVTLGQSWTVAEYHFGDKRWINLLGERETIEPEYWQEVNLPEEVLEIEE